MGRVLLHYSSGAASAVMSALTLKDLPEAIMVKAQTNSEHSDNDRFDRDVESWVGRSITYVSSTQYLDTWHVWEDRSYIAGIEGAPCTGALKRAPREAFQRPDDIHLFGYTAEEEERSKLLRENNPALSMAFPLIQKGITKDACLAIIQGAGIKLPEMYLLGFQNNNCIPCPKATSPNYWAAIRKHFPAEFDRMAALSRRLGVRLVIVGREKCEDGKARNIRAFIDEIPADQPTLNPIVPACDFLCHIAEQDLAA
jgi:3'-phosphoadenosine 5'-phosphosulfate sulfotransferase (PAPS reductase)/FAD synthetase